MTKLEEKKRYENEHKTAQGEALERTRQEEEKPQLEKTLLQQIEELKLQETKVILTFSSLEKGICCFTWKYRKADLTSSLHVCTAGRGGFSLPAEEQSRVQTLVKHVLWDVVLSLGACFPF